MLESIKQIAEIAFYVASTTAIVTQLLKDERKSNKVSPSRLPIYS